MEIVKGYGTSFEKMETGRKRQSSKYKKATSYAKPIPSSLASSFSNDSIIDTSSHRMNLINNNESIEIKL